MKKFISAVISTGLILGSIPCTAIGAEEKSHILTFLDYDGNYYYSLSIPEGMVYNTDDDVYVDTSALNGIHTDVYTEVGFNCWSEGSVTMDGDKTVKALYKKMTIGLESQPKKLEYYSNTGAIDLDGLKIPISVSIQTRELDENGENKVENSVTYIESRCSTSPINLDEAFEEGNTASVMVYPFHSDKPILTYDICYFPNLGDANLDGRVDGLDASLVLEMASNKNFSFEEGQKARCDIDRNGRITSDDASLILNFYADASSCSSPDWEKFFSKK